MKIKIKTLVLQALVAKAVKGASQNKMAPLTSLMGIKLEDGRLTLTTTDGNNKLEVSENKVEGKPFSVTVQVDLFSKLVAKTTTETIVMTLEDSKLKLKGNGEYIIDLPLDEDGELIDYPTIPYSTFESAVGGETELTSIKAVITANKAAIAETLEVPALTGYYFDDGVVTTDSFKVCSTSIKILPEKKLLPAELVDLLGVLTEEKISVKIVEDEILFETGNIAIYGYALEDIEDYPINSIKQYLETAFKSNCSFPKQGLIDVLDRVNLFVSAYDKAGIYLDFTKNGLSITSKQNNGVELVAYQTSSEFKGFTCHANIELLRSQLAAQPGEVVTIWYGHEMALKVTTPKITQIIALLQDDRLGADNE